jgi:uncharacterized protein
MRDTIDYTSVKQALNQLALEYLPAEFHGLFSGVVTVGSAKQTEQLVHELMNSVDNQNVIQREALDTLNRLMSQTVTQLKSPDFSFRLLLASEENSIAEQAQTLSEWVDGFLFGLGIAWGDTKPDEADIQEVIEDFGAVARLDYQQVTESEALELEELHEFVRAGVMMLFEHYKRNPQRTQP